MRRRDGGVALVVVCVVVVLRNGKWLVEHVLDLLMDKTICDAVIDRFAYGGVLERGGGYSNRTVRCLEGGDV